MAVPQVMDSDTPYPCFFCSSGHLSMEFSSADLEQAVRRFNSVGHLNQILYLPKKKLGQLNHAVTLFRFRCCNHIPTVQTLIGFTDDVHAAYVTPRMSVIEDQAHLMGVTACQLLFKNINGDQTIYKEIVPQKLVIRETSAKNK